MSCRCDNPVWHVYSDVVRCDNCGNTPATQQEYSVPPPKVDIFPHPADLPKFDVGRYGVAKVAHDPVRKSIDDVSMEEWDRASAKVRAQARASKTLPTPTSVIAPPSRVVGMCEFQGQIIVACEGGVYRLDNGCLIPIPFAQAPKHTQD